MALSFKMFSQPWSVLLNPDKEKRALLITVITYWRNFSECVILKMVLKCLFFRIDTVNHDIPGTAQCVRYAASLYKCSVLEMFRSAEPELRRANLMRGLLLEVVDKVRHKLPRVGDD
jgi:hypothetical protein